MRELPEFDAPTFRAERLIDLYDPPPPQLGALAKLGAGAGMSGNGKFVPRPREKPVVNSRAVNLLRMTPQERYLYQHHLNNLTGSGKVINDDGTVSTIRNITTGIDGRTYVSPTIWDGKELPAREAQKRAAAVGWNKWPSYPTRDAADKRYDQMHGVMNTEVERAMSRSDWSSPSRPQEDARRKMLIDTLMKAKPMQWPKKD